MKYILNILLSFTALFISSTAVAEHRTCGTPHTVNLVAGQYIDSGSVSVRNDEVGNLTITFLTISPWQLSETHLHVATSLEGIPKTRRGNPKVGNFAYKIEHNPSVSEFSYVISADEIGYSIGDSIVVATHAVVQNINNDVVVQQETGWGQGEDFPGRNWAMYFTYTLQACDGEPQSEILPGDFRTQTQGGWGTICRGNNPGCYRDTHFPVAFPNGALIGDSSGLDTENGLFAALFTSSQAVEEFLPQGGTPSSLSMDHEDPAVSEAGVLAGQVTALTLSVYFDYNDVSFGASSVNLSDLIVAPGSDTQCDGMTVWQILETGNRVLSGDTGTGFTTSAINACISSINENFVDGTMVGGYLTLP